MMAKLPQFRCSTGKGSDCKMFFRFSVSGLVNTVSVSGSEDSVRDGAEDSTANVLLMLLPITFI